MKKILYAGISILIILFLTGCTTLDSIKPFKGQQGALTSTIGGKGVVVQFLPGKPPLNEIDGSFTLGIKLLNYNTQDIFIESFVVGSTYEHKSFPTLAKETVFIERAITQKTPQGLIFKGPGTQVTYTGSGRQLRDGSIHYGPFRYINIGNGVKTQFFVVMHINYESTFPFQFCSLDIQTQLNFGTGCNPIETISGSKRLGFNVDVSPVIVSQIEKTIVSDVDTTKIRLDITLRDTSASSGNEEGHIIKQTEGTEELEKIFFELKSITGGEGFICKSPNLVRTSTAASMDVYLIDGEAKIRCEGGIVLTEEQLDSQYSINLQYPYYQRITTDSILIRTDKQRSFVT